MSKPARVWIAAGLVAFAGMTALSLSRIGRDAPAAGGALPRSDVAPDFRGIEAWVNSPPLGLPALRGKVVLVDFWTYSCINCIRTLPGLKNLYARYKPAGFEIVGVHAPEFAFERSLANVRRAVAEHAITWPVALDNKMETWRAYRNHYWPHVYLIDQTGKIRFDHIGEGGEDVVEEKIRVLLASGGAALPPDQVIPEATFAPDMTREIYLGFDRGSPGRMLANREGYHPDEAFTYPQPSERLVQTSSDGVFFLAGRWTAGGEFVRAEAVGARIILPFNARDVYFVAAPDRTDAVTARLLLDGEPLSEAVSGAHVKASSVRIGAQTLYHLVHLGGTERHRLEIVAEAPGLAVYTFTFG